MSTEKESKIDRDNVTQVRSFAPRLIELYLWCLISLIVSGRVWLYWWLSLNRPSYMRMPLSEIVAQYYLDLLLGVVVILFPILFSLIFGRYPIEHIRARRVRNSIRIPDTTIQEVTSLTVQDASDVNEIELTDLEPESPEELFKKLAYSSRKLSESIYTRAGVYLLIGVLIAFTGLIFFYTQTGRLSDIREVTNLLLNLVPRFGILFFIELIAFFFLRQYRIAMDEFRYFEAIKRSREETLALIRLANQQGEGLNPQDLLAKCSFYSNAGKLSAGESTELLESKKLDKNELELVEKLLDVLGRTAK